MTKTPIVPAGWEEWYSDWHFSPAVASGGFVFVSGCIGTHRDGTISTRPQDQIRQAFEKVCEALASAGATFADVVEMTTYHVGMASHLDLFRRVKDEFVGEPYPAWTAIGVAELVNPKAIVEIRVIARQPAD